MIISLTNHTPVRILLASVIAFLAFNHAPLSLAMQNPPVHNIEKTGSVNPSKLTYSSNTVGNTIFGVASLAATGAGLLLPHKTPAQIGYMRTYFLSALTAQTIGSVAKNIKLDSTTSEEKTSGYKMAVDVGYGLYNLMFVEIARRLPVKTAANIKTFRAYSALCLLSQGAGTIVRDSCAPYCASACTKLASIATRIPETSSESLLHTLDLY